MNWFSDMLLLWLEWLLILIIPLLIGIWIGWAIWHRGKRRQDDGQSSRIKELEAELAVYKDSSAETLEDDLSQISGLTEECEQKLKSEGIKTYYSLALLKANEVDQLEQKLGCPLNKIRNENWVPQAAQLHYEKHGEEIYDRVSVEGVYADAFERQMAEAKRGRILDYIDDLKRISGVGPKMEQLLHDFGLYTFYQISKLDDDGVEALNARLEFFSGRIKRDDWIGQAKRLHSELHED